jgi:hypothetical protein
MAVLTARAFITAGLFFSGPGAAFSTIRSVYLCPNSTLARIRKSSRRRSG